MPSANKFVSLIFTGLMVASLSGCAAMCNNFGCSGCGPAAVGGCDSCDQCNGCGELYVDPWINHPADCCDPCDTCGNYNGQSCGSCRPLFAGIGSWWGYRNPACCDGMGGCGVGGCGGCEPTCGCGVVGCGGCEPTCGCGPVCDGGCFAEPACGCEPGCGCEVCAPACGCEAGSSCQNCVAGTVSEGNVRVVVEPSYDNGITETMPAPYRPYRTKKIFRPRPRVAEGPIQFHR